MKNAKKYRGPTLDSFLKQECVYDELKSVVVKEAIAWQFQQTLAQKAHEQEEAG